MANEVRYYPQLMAEGYDKWQLYRELQAISDVVDRLYSRVDALESIRDTWEYCTVARPTWNLSRD